MTMQQERIPCRTEGCTNKHKPEFDLCYDCSMKAKGYVICGVDGCDRLKDPQFDRCYNHNQIHRNKQPATQQQAATVTTQFVEKVPSLLTDNVIKDIVDMEETMGLLDLTTADAAEQLGIPEAEVVTYMNMLKIFRYAMIYVPVEIKGDKTLEPKVDENGLEDLPWD